MCSAKAFVYAAEEDFGIAAVEAQAAGCPVIAYGRGGLTETVVEGKTGLFFLDQSAEGIIQAVRIFEKAQGDFIQSEITHNAARFNAGRFKYEISEFVAEKWANPGE